MKKEIIHEELSGKIIGAAMGVLNDLKPGLDEKLHERALVVESRAARSHRRCSTLVSGLLQQRTHRAFATRFDRR